MIRDRLPPWPGAAFATMLLAATTLVWVPSVFCDDVPDTAIATSRTLAEIAKLFQKGDQRIDLDTVKAIFTACHAEYDPGQPYDNQSNAFFDRLRQFFEYSDSHRIEEADLDALVRWQAGLLECRDAPRGDWATMPKTTLRSMHHTIVDLSKDAKNNNATCQPRHAALCSALDATTGSYSAIHIEALRIRDNLRTERTPARDTISPVRQFLMSSHGEPLRRALLDDLDLFDTLGENPECGAMNFAEQDCLDSRNDPNEFKRRVMALLPHMAKMTRMNPDFDCKNLYHVTRSIRADWNMVHAYGDEEAKVAAKDCIEALRDHYAEKGDDLAVMWLTQAMEPPGKPPRFFIATFVPVEPKPSEKKEK